MCLIHLEVQHLNTGGEDGRQDKEVESSVSFELAASNSVT